MNEQELRARAADDGIEFFLAMFVDMHGKPCAKLVPATAIDLLLSGGAGGPRHAGGTRPCVVHENAVATERRGAAV
jgi:hypothetical protein